MCPGSGLFTCVLYCVVLLQHLCVVCLKLQPLCLNKKKGTTYAGMSGASGCGISSG